LDEVSDPGVARLKLQWWRDELARTYAGEPRHPLSGALKPALERYRLPDTAFLEMAEQVESEILRRQPSDQADLNAGCERDLGALFELIARCHGLSDTPALHTARRLGGFCAQVYLIRDSGALARKGRYLLPTDSLRECGLSADSLAQRQHRSQLPDLLAPAAGRARSGIPEPNARKDLPACIRARARIMEVLLEEIADEGFDVADQRIGLTPLRKLWLAWRESRGT
jgi:phytoene synthase